MGIRAKIEYILWPIVGPVSAVRLVWAAYWMIPEDHDWVKPEEGE